MRFVLFVSLLFVTQLLNAELVEDVRGANERQVEQENSDDFDVQAFLADDDSSPIRSDDEKYADDEIHSSLKTFVLNEVEKETNDVETVGDGKNDEDGNIIEYTLPEKHISDKSNFNEEVDLSKMLQKGVVELKEIVIQVLDKKSTTCRFEKISLEKNVSVGDLTVVLKRAFMTGEHVIPFSITGYLEIYEKGQKIFGGWMTSSLPSAVTFDHAIYDIKITSEKD